MMKAAKSSIDYLNISKVEILTLTWGSEDSITGKYQWEVSGTRKQLALLFSIMEYHEDTKSDALKVSIDVNRLKLRIDFGTIGTKAIANVIEQLYYFKVEQFNGKNPFMKGKRV